MSLGSEYHFHFPRLLPFTAGAWGELGLAFC